MKNAKNSVAVVASGACTPLGTTWERTRTHLLNGETSIKPDTIHGEKTCTSRIPSNWIESSESGDLPRYAQIASLAIDDLMRECEPLDDPSLGIVASTSKGGLGSTNEKPFTSMMNPGIWSQQVALDFENVNTVTSINSACATGTSALIQGARWICDRVVDQVVVIAAESCFTPLLMAGYQSLNVFCDERGMRPFHSNRTGFALGEAASAILLIRSELINEFDTKPNGRIRGWAETCDAHHITRMDSSGAQVQNAIDLAIHRGKVSQDEIDILHAHLTTTPNNDEIEEEILRGWPGDVFMQAIKPALGHTIGAAGLLESIATLHTLRTDEYFPINGVDEKNLPVPSQPDKNKNKDNRYGLSWNMGFGGHNAAILLESPWPE